MQALLGSIGDMDRAGRVPSRSQDRHLPLELDMCQSRVSVEVESSTDLPLTGFCARLRQKERNLRPELHELTRIVGEAHHGFTLVNG